MDLTLQLAPGIAVSLDHATATRAYEDLGIALEASDPDAAGVLTDDHPLWDRFPTTAKGYDDPEWTPTDGALAEAFYAQVKGKAKVFLDLLLDRPGRQITVDQLIDASGDAFTSSFSIAGAINGLRLPQAASGRRYPFMWWEGTPSRYAIKPSVAALFNAARAGAR